MTPTEREFGKLEAELSTLQHRSRNDRMILQALGERMEELSVSLERLRARIYAAVAVVLVLSGMVAWLVDVAISINS